MVQWKPEAYTSLAPYMIVDGAQRFLEFMQAAFNAQPLRMYHTKDGKVLHGEAKVDDTVIMFADSTERYPAIPSVLHLYVPDVDATIERALRAGATLEQKPQQHEGDPDRRGGVKDPVGILWSIATQVK